MLCFFLCAALRCTSPLLPHCTAFLLYNIRFQSKGRTAAHIVSFSIPVHFSNLSLSIASRLAFSIMFSPAVREALLDRRLTFVVLHILCIYKRGLTEHSKSLVFCLSLPSAIDGHASSIFKCTGPYVDISDMQVGI